MTLTIEQMRRMETVEMSLLREVAGFIMTDHKSEEDTTEYMG
jgi:hypothetical protein